MPSAESRNYLLQMLRATPAFGAEGFSLQELRTVMATGSDPTVPATQCRPVMVGHIPAQWVLAPGAESDVRLLYLHGGGFVSGS